MIQYILEATARFRRERAWERIFPGNARQKDKRSYICGRIRLRMGDFTRQDLKGLRRATHTHTQTHTTAIESKQNKSVTLALQYVVCLIA